MRRWEHPRGPGIVSAVLERPTGNVEIVRPDGQNGALSQPGQPDRRVALHRRGLRDCLAEELRRLDPDEIYENTLQGLTSIVRDEQVQEAGVQEPPEQTEQHS